jgi:hypothetical protein
VRERGSVSILVAAALAALLVIAMGSADVVRVLTTAARAQTAADAAALAGDPDFFWWAFSSTTLALETLSQDMFCGARGCETAARRALTLRAGRREVWGADDVCDRGGRVLRHPALLGGADRGGVSAAAVLVLRRHRGACVARARIERDAAEGGRAC